MNKYRKFIRLVFASIFGLGVGALASCSDVTTEHLLGDPAINPPDAALLGTWYLADEDGTIAILKMRPVDVGVALLEEGAEVTTVTEATLFLLETGEANSGGTSVSWIKHNFYATKQDGASYLNATFIDAGPDAEDGDDGMQGNRIFRYELNDDGQLVVWSMSPGNMADAVETRQIAGNVTRSKFSKDVHLTATPEALRQFLAQSPPGMVFPEDNKAGPFQKLSPSPNDAP
jgi:hypothetical protein